MITSNKNSPIIEKICIEGEVTLNNESQNIFEQTGLKMANNFVSEPNDLGFHHF